MLQNLIMRATSGGGTRASFFQTETGPYWPKSMCVYLTTSRVNRIYKKKKVCKNWKVYYYFGLNTTPKVLVLQLRLHRTITLSFNFLLLSLTLNNMLRSLCIPFVKIYVNWLYQWTNLTTKYYFLTFNVQ